jgi:hypothetical protein
MHVATVHFFEVMLIEFYVNKICNNYVNSLMNDDDNDIIIIIIRQIKSRLAH